MDTASFRTVSSLYFNCASWIVTVHCKAAVSGDNTGPG